MTQKGGLPRWREAFLNAEVVWERVQVLDRTSVGVTWAANVTVKRMCARIYIREMEEIVYIQNLKLKANQKEAFY